MKRHTLITIISGLAFLMISGGAFGQAMRSAYFLEGATYRHQLNPAFIGKRGYVSFPAIGNLNISAQSNIGLSNFVFKNPDGGDKYTTFMNKSISRKDFLDKIKDVNTIGLDLSLPILSFGFHGWGGYNTFEIGIKSKTNLNMPYELFDFMKTGMSGKENYYLVKDVGLRTNNYADISLGHAHTINKNLTIGAKLKVLLGLANIHARYDEMNIKMNEDKWEIHAKGTLEASLGKAYFELEDEPNESGEYEITGFDMDSFGLTGFGLAVDLGATYKMDQFVPGLTLSAALLDLGYISWNKTIKGQTSASSFEFGGFTEIGVNSGSDSKPIEDQLEDQLDNLEGMIKFYDAGKGGSRSTSLAATLNIGAEYIFPYYRKLTFGLLSSTQFNKPNTWTEARLSANVAPLNWFDASVNFAVSTYGTSFGWMLNFHQKGIGFFVGTDHNIMKVNPWFIPVNKFNANVNLGFNILFGGAKKNVLAAN